MKTRLKIFVETLLMLLLAHSLVSVAASAKLRRRPQRKDYSNQEPSSYAAKTGPGAESN